MADRDRLGGANRSSSQDDAEWQQWPEEALYEARVRTPGEEWEQWPEEVPHGHSRSPQLGEEVWEELPGEILHETQALSLAEDDWERWPELTIDAHQTNPQPGEEIWEELPEEAMRQPQMMSSEEAIHHSLDASLHPALRFHFKIQQTWDRAPEMVSPTMTGANPHAVAFSPLSGATADDGPRDQRAYGERRRHRSRVPSPELNSRHRHRRHQRGDSNNQKPDSPLEEEPRHRHTKHRRLRSETLVAEAGSNDIVVERHAEEDKPTRRRHHRSERRRSRTPEHKADSNNMIGGHHTKARSHSRHVHFRSDEDADGDDHKERRSRHRSSSRHPGYPGGRTTASCHDREHRGGGNAQEDDGATTSHRRHHRHLERRTTRA